MPGDEMIAFVDNLNPMRLKKTPYWDRPEFAGRYNRNPYFEREKHASPGVQFEELWGQLAYLAAWWLTPDPVAGLIILTPLIVFLASLFGGAG
jgi:type IV secretion system protein VirD4